MRVSSARTTGSAVSFSQALWAPQIHEGQEFTLSRSQASQRGFTATSEVVLWLQDKEGWLLPLAYPVLGFLLLLPRGNHGSLQLKDTWGMHVATHGDPHTKQRP